MSKPVPPRLPPRMLSSEQAAFIRSLEPAPQNDADDGSPDRPIDQSTGHPVDQSTDRPVTEATAVPVQRRSKAPRRGGRALFTRASGEAVRKLSFYFPPDLARELHLHCVARDQDMSAFVTDVVRRVLARSST